jgi:prolyl oligopeptidase
VLIDPNTWSPDGTVRLAEFAPSPDARYAVYAVSRSGSDWLEYRVLDLESQSPLPDTIEWVKVSSAAWSGDGFYYSRYPEPPPGKALSSSNEHHRVFYHRLRTPQDADDLSSRIRASPCGSI